MANSLSIIDHLVFAASDLAQGVAWIENLLGIRPASGGSHPQWGTRNALLSLGDDTYLEVIGPDLENPPPAAPRPFGIDHLKSPRLVTWAAKATGFEKILSAATRAGIDLGAVRSGGRLTDQGVQLTWTQTDPAPARLDGLLPFFINWGASPHPARSAPAAGTLIELRLRHPEPERIRPILAAFEIDFPLEQAAEPGLIAAIRTNNGVVRIE